MCSLLSSLLSTVREDNGENEMCSGEKASVVLQDGGGNGLGVFQGGYVYECLSKKPPKSPK